MCSANANPIKTIQKIRTEYRSKLLDIEQFTFSNKFTISLIKKCFCYLNDLEIKFKIDEVIKYGSGHIFGIFFEVDNLQKCDIITIPS